MAKILVIDDEAPIGWSLSRLAQSMGHEASTARTAELGIEAARRERPDAICLDVRLPGQDGLSSMQALREAAGPVPVIVMTAFGDLATAAEAVRLGAFELLVKPFGLDLAERTIARAIEHRGHFPPQAAGSMGESIDGLPSLPEPVLIGDSAAMRELFRQIAMVAASEACVHISGESGTGKELAARAIHRYSTRAKGPFVAVSLAALNPGLVEAELFGSVAGAYTGATHARQGLLVAADQGTIFLDEIADVPPGVQVKLLRALEYGEVLPVGASQAVRSNFRVLSATHRDLRDDVQCGRFRHDLYFRLSTFRLQMPALRERMDDLPLLVQELVRGLATRAGLGAPELADGLIEHLSQRPWPGNVRELRNVLEHALVLARGGRIGIEHLPATLSWPSRDLPDQSPKDRFERGDSDNNTEHTAAQFRSLIRRWTAEQWSGSAAPNNLLSQLQSLVEPTLLAEVLERSRGQVAPAARSLGLHRVTLRQKLIDYGIVSDE